MFNLKVIGWGFYSRKEKPLSAVPILIIVILISSLLAQVYWRVLRPATVIEISQLPNPPSINLLRVISFGEKSAISAFLMLWLQAFDNQPGVSIPLKDLDYRKVTAWLDTILSLNPKSQYALLSAARVYSAIQDEDKKLIMLEFIREKYLDDPNTRWQAMAHAAFIVKHRLKDLPLALQYARDLRENTTDENVPSWVRQMELFVLEDMGEFEAAQILLGGFMESGVIKNQQEFQFLIERFGIANLP